MGRAGYRRNFRGTGEAKERVSGEVGRTQRVRRIRAPFAQVWGRAGGMGRVVAVTFPGRQRQIEVEEGVEAFPGGWRRLRKEGEVAMTFSVG